MLEIIAYCLGGLTLVVFIAFIIVWACMQEQQFGELDKEIEEIKKKQIIIKDLTLWKIYFIKLQIVRWY